MIAILTMTAASLAAGPDCLPIRSGEGGTPIVQARVNGAAPVDLVLDTGSSGTTIDPETADRLRLPHDAATETAQGMGGAVSVAFRRVRSLSAGPLRMEDVALPSVPAPRLAGDAVAGLGGTDLFGERMAQWEPGSGCVAIGPGGSEPAGRGWRPIAVRWLQPWKIMVPIRIGRVAGWALLDTGAQFTTLNPAFAAALRVRAVAGGATMTGIDGRPLRLASATVAAVSVGPWAWRRVRVQVGALPVFDRLKGAGDRLAILGMDWLATRGFAIDYRTRRVWLLAGERRAKGAGAAAR